MFTIHKSKKGFTLVEILLYFSLVSMVLLVVVSFYGTITQTESRNRTISEVDQSGMQVMEYLTALIRNSTLINSPNTAGQTTNTLSFNTSTAANNPTIIDLSSNAIRIKEGSASNINLTSNNIIASNLTFTNLTTTGSKSVIKFQFTLSFKNLTGRTEQDYTRTFYATATLR